MDLTKADVLESFEDGTLWKRFRKIIDGDTLMGCGFGDIGGEIEGAKSDGLLKNHAYGVIGCQKAGQFRLIKCRNP